MLSLSTAYRSSLSALARPVSLLRGYTIPHLRPDLIAGLTVAAVLLPQAIAYALVADLPPQTGLYTAIVGAIVAAFWGSSNHLQTGPTSAVSLLVLSTLLPLGLSSVQDYVAVASLLAIMVGLFRLAMGMARLSIIVNFVSDAVIVGFTAGAAILIGVGQLRHLLGIEADSSLNLLTSVTSIAAHLDQVHPPTLFLGLLSLAILLSLRRFRPQAPGALLAMVGASMAVALLGSHQGGVEVIGALPQTLPRLGVLPKLNLDLLGSLSPGALAIAAIGLVEAMSIARSIAGQTGQRLNSNQEFVGQGLANLASGLLGGFTCSGSLPRSTLNFKAGAQTPLASVFSAIFVLIATLALAPLAAYLPRAALAAVLLVLAYDMVDYPRMARIFRSSRADSGIMLATLLATLLLPLEFAVLAGIFMSLGYYVLETSTPKVITVLPTLDFRHFLHQPSREDCPQLGIISVLGDLYFGAVNHVEESIRRHMAQNPDERYLLLRLQNVNHIDISGVHMLETLVKAYRDRGGDLYLMKTKQPIFDLMQSTGFVTLVGEDHFLAEEQAIAHLFHRVLDPAVCIYECEVRAFWECQNLPKLKMSDSLRSLSTSYGAPIPGVTAEELWQEMRNRGHGPRIVDVREAWEYERGHIPGSTLLPLSRMDLQKVNLPKDEALVLVCRSGQRSRRAAQAFLAAGFRQVRNLEGGMVAWEGNELMESISQFR